MSDQNIVRRILASLGRLASLPETRIREQFESVSDDETEAWDTMLGDAVEKAERVTGEHEDQPDDPRS